MGVRAGGPGDFSLRATLSDGTEVTVRAIRSDDAERIREAFGKLDQEAIYRRFFSPKRDLSSAELKQLTEVDFDQVVALVATAEQQGVETLLGGARYAVQPGEPPRSAEVAFLTAEAYRGRGIAGLLLRSLEQLARAAGLSRFEADVLADNQSMLNVFRSTGLKMEQCREGNVVHITLWFEPSEQA
jgi:RimJ/RimL family protein N-acetyltransferase